MDEGEETSAGKFHIEVLPLSVFFLCRLTELLKIKEAHLKWTVIKHPYCYCQQLRDSNYCFPSSVSEKSLLGSAAYLGKRN